MHQWGTTSSQTDRGAFSKGGQVQATMRGGNEIGGGGLGAFFDRPEGPGAV